MIRWPRIASATLLLSLLFGCTTATDVPQRPPNIVLIMADDAGTEAFSCYGSTSCATPEIDRLARDGMRFLHAYSQPVCTPTRVKLLTGQSNARNYQAFSVLRPGERTFAHALRSRGYRTCVVGKWQLLAAQHYPDHIRGTGQSPMDAGFDEWCLWQVEQLGKRYWKPRFETNGELRTAGETEYGPDLYTDYLIDFIGRNKNAPFLAYYPMALPHNPFLPTPEDVARDPSIDLRKKHPRYFVSMISYVDKLVGRIRKKLDDEGIADNTIFLFTCDNGTNRNIRSKVGDRVVRGAKNQTKRAGSRVPLVAYWPGTIRAGSECDDLIDFADFYATFGDAAGFELSEPQRADGRSFLPQLRGREGTPRDALYCYFHPRPLTRKRSTARRYVFDKRFKLYANGSLYDMDRDPDEERPLPDAGEHSPIRERLRRHLGRAPKREK